MKVKEGFQRVLVVMPCDLVERISELADREHRSRTSQIIHLLECATGEPGEAEAA